MQTFDALKSRLWQCQTHQGTMELLKDRSFELPGLHDLTLAITEEGFSEREKIGLVNLYNYGCCGENLKREGACLGSSQEGASSIRMLLGLIRLCKDDAVTLVDVAKYVSSSGSRNSHLSKTRSSWHEFVNESEPPERALRDTLFGQTLLMHSLRAISPFYRQVQERKRNNSRWVDHLALNPALVAILRGIFSRTDLARNAFHLHAFSFDCSLPGRDMSPSSESEERVLYEVYVAELDWLAATASKLNSSRGTLTRLLKELSNSSENELDDQIVLEVRKSIHGANDSIDDTEKHTRFCQLTCMIRDIDEGMDDATASSSRKYTPHLTEVRPFTLGPELFLWPAQSKWNAESPGYDRFRKLLTDVFSDGYEIKFLENVAKWCTLEIQDGTEGPGVAWIQDGEIVFLHLLLALASVGESRRDWLDRKLDKASFVKIRLQSIGALDQFEPLSTGDSLKQFVEERLVLFTKNSPCLPTGRFHALMNFLHRIGCGEFSPRYGENTALRNIAEQLLLGIQGVPISESFGALKNALREIDFSILDIGLSENAANSCEKLVESILNTSMLPTVWLEFFLRDGTPHPVTLFFFPLTYERLQDSSGGFSMVPGAFLAGTLAGLEWPTFPAIAERQNTHLLTGINAIRPIIDQMIGRSLRKDMDEIRMLRDRAGRRQFAHVVQGYINSIRAAIQHKHSVTRISALKTLILGPTDSVETEAALAATRQLQFTVNLFSESRKFRKVSQQGYVDLASCVQDASNLALMRLRDRCVVGVHKLIDEQLCRSVDNARDFNDAIQDEIVEKLTGTDGWLAHPEKFARELTGTCLEEFSKQRVSIRWDESAEEGLFTYLLMQALFHAAVFERSLKVADSFGFEPTVRTTRGPFAKIEWSPDFSEVTVSNRCHGIVYNYESTTDFATIENIVDKFNQVEPNAVSFKHVSSRSDSIGNWFAIELNITR